jgi:hypothetical protein
MYYFDLFTKKKCLLAPFLANTFREQPVLKVRLFNPIPKKKCVAYPQEDFLFLTQNVKKNCRNFKSTNQNKNFPKNTMFLTFKV